MTTIMMHEPPPLTARLVFMTTQTITSDLIRFQEEGAVSHVAAMMDDGLFMTANIGEGVRRTRQVDEFAGVTLAISVDIPMKWDEYKSWQEFLYSKNGVPFDTGSLIGFALHWDTHTQGSLFCASLQVSALRHCGYFPRPLSQRWHMITPVILLLMLQALPLSTGVIVHDPVTEP